MQLASAETLNEAYERLLGYGPEFGADEEGDNGLTNHGPMAVEVICRRGLGLDAHRWLDRYVDRLVELPTAREPITDWADALGGGARRVGDWTAYFDAQLPDHAWRDVLVTWWPRLLPGIVAGSTHGVIRVGHAVRALLAGPVTAPALAELGRGLAFWAARYRPLPAIRPAGAQDVADALATLPRLPQQRGLIAQRLARLDRMPAWTDAASAVRAPAGADAVPNALADLVHAATLSYLSTAPASPVLLIHAATAPNAVLHTLPVLPQEMWGPSYAAAWSASAALVSAYAPVGAQPAAPPSVHPTSALDAPFVALDRAARHGDEHVLKFTDTAVDVYGRTGDPRALAAAALAAELIAVP